MSKQQHTLIYIIAALLLACGFMYFSGGVPGVSHDSLMYFQSADYLYNGEGYLTKQYGEVKPAMHFPPLYPICLVVARTVTGADFTVASIWLNGLLWLLAIGGLALLFSRYKIHPAFAILCMVQQGVIHTYFMAWSEPLFITLSIWGFYFLFQGLKQERIRKMACGAVLFGFATLARYNGFIFLPLAVLVVLMHQPALKSKGRAGVVLAGAYLIPVILWFIRNVMVSGKMMKRDSVVTDHHITDGFFNTGLTTLSGWIYPGWFGLELIAGFLMTLAFVFVLIWMMYRSLKQNEHGLTPAITLGLAIFLQMGLIIFTVMFADKTTLPDQRIMSFANLCFILLMIFLLASPHHEIRWKPVLQRNAWILFFVLMALELSQSYHTLDSHRRYSSDFTASDILTQKPVINTIKNIHDSLPIVSVNQEDIYLHYLTGKTIGYGNDLYTMPHDQQMYFAFFHENHQLPETGITYLDVDSIIPGYLYKLRLKN